MEGTYTLTSVCLPNPADYFKNKQIFGKFCTAAWETKIKKMSLSGSKSTDEHRVRKKNIADIFDCNLKDYQIQVIFDTNTSDTTGDQMTVQFFTTLIVCFCTTWGNNINEILHFYPILPVRVFPGSAEADIWWGEN